jgi:uncharacterized protein YabN with tetrapyrrole methylase and pyrophosphatase domain
MQTKFKGSLTIIGTGISVGHLTRESLRHLEVADFVLYCVADVATERLIQKIKPDAESLFKYYDDDKPRGETYKEMTNRILEVVREEKNVCVAFYGHPGIFVNPAHSAIEKARNEGFKAQMLPAVSSLDCLFADLGIDPAWHGCQIFEATHLLCRNKKLDPFSSVIILQVGCVGDWGWKLGGYDARHLHVLTELLNSVYGDEYEVVVYQASTTNVCPPLIRVVKIKDLVSACVTGISTLYIAPIDHAPLDFELVKYFKDEAVA